MRNPNYISPFSNAIDLHYRKRGTETTLIFRDFFIKECILVFQISFSLKKSNTPFLMPPLSIHIFKIFTRPTSIRNARKKAKYRRKQKHDCAVKSRVYLPRSPR